jgi:hypothetical protein
MSTSHAQANAEQAELALDWTDQNTSGRRSPTLGSPESLLRTIEDLLPPNGPTDLMSRRGAEARRAWTAMTATPLYESLTVWVMAAWPEQPLERIDVIVRTAIAEAHRVREGEWTLLRLMDVMRKAGRRREHREVHRHLGHPVNLISYDAAAFELADEVHQPRSKSSSTSLGTSLVNHLRLALGGHNYMVTPSAAALLDVSCDIAVDHLNLVQSRSISAERPNGLIGLDLFAAARPTKGANKSNRITDVFGDLAHPTRVALSRLLLGTDRQPEAALLWRHAAGMTPLGVPDQILADWRADLPALSPSIVASTDRRRRRMRDRSRRGEDLRRVFELAAAGDLEICEQAIAI